MPSQESLLHRTASLAVVATSLTLAAATIARGDDPAAVKPDQVIKPFNGRDLTGFTTWLKETGHKDPSRAFRVTDGVIHITGEGRGYLATNNAYRDYHLVVEYKWGQRTDGSKYVRNSGILLHARGPHGNAGGVWMTSLECQLAQGCEGDFIVIRGKDKSGQPVPFTITANIRKGLDGRPRWSPGGKPTRYSGRQFWWHRHDHEFKELLDTRGRWDVASPLGKWTKVECICRGDRVSVKINGELVNECYNVKPSSGRILLQNEGNEIYFRNLEIRPLPAKQPAKPAGKSKAK